MWITATSGDINLQNKQFGKGMQRFGKGIQRYPSFFSSWFSGVGNQPKKRDRNTSTLKTQLQSFMDFSRWIRWKLMFWDDDPQSWQQQVKNGEILWYLTPQKILEFSWNKFWSLSYIFFGLNHDCMRKVQEGTRLGRGELGLNSHGWLERTWKWMVGVQRRSREMCSLRSFELW